MVIATTLEDLPPRASRQPLLLLVCQAAALRRRARQWLEDAGFEVVAPETDAEVSRRLEERWPDLLVLDPASRDEAGSPLHLAVRRRRGGEDLPVLGLCSGPRQLDAALAQGVDDVLTIPRDWRLAARRAAELVRQAQRRSELRQAREELERLRLIVDGAEAGNHAFPRDPLTGLPDRDHFERALASALAAGTWRNGQLAVMLVDINHFLRINSSLGRSRANSLLQQFAQRLTAGLRSRELWRARRGPSFSMAARLSADVFAAMLTGLGSREQSKRTAQQLLDQLSANYHLADQMVALSASAGVAMAPDDGCPAAELLQNAELALSEAIERGSGGIVFYDETDHQLRERGGAIATRLVRAMARGELTLHFQPLVDCQSGRICAAEALVRWDSPELGPVPPAEFVPLAEESGLMTQIGTWVLASACRQLRRWLDQGLPPIRVAVNVSLCQLLRGDLASQLRSLLAETGVDPALVELELSERGTLRSDPDIQRQLLEIKELGVRLAIDDFGTGNTGIWYLRSFRLDTLKIDRSFVKGLATSPEDAAITNATIAMARQLGLRVVAEGVEEVAQLELLRRSGCHEVQGYLFFPPLPAEAVGELLARDPVAAPTTLESIPTLELGP